MRSVIEARIRDVPESFETISAEKVHEDERIVTRNSYE